MFWFAIGNALLEDETCSNLEKMVDQLIARRIEKKATLTRKILWDYLLVCLCSRFTIDSSHIEFY